MRENQSCWTGGQPAVQLFYDNGRLAGRWTDRVADRLNRRGLVLLNACLLASHKLTRDVTRADASRAGESIILRPVGGPSSSYNGLGID